jgi:histidinol phosphatase-like enzyme (inositol monophosphatase family)
VPDPTLRALLDVAMEGAYLAGRHALGYFNTGVTSEAKADNSPVTVADREAERVLREHIARAFPGHAILGEEEGETTGNNAFRWIVDPIDGTKTFLAGVPLWGVLVGVEVRGAPAVGVIYLPALDEMVCAADGLGCAWNGRPCRVSSTNCLDESLLLTTSVTACRARSDAWDNLAARTRLQRTWGDCYGYVLVATGRADIMLDPAMNPWDSAALLPILREAGGHFSDWQGTPTIWTGDAMATNAVLAAPILDALRTEKKRA